MDWQILADKRKLSFEPFCSYLKGIGESNKNQIVAIDRVEKLMDIKSQDTVTVNCWYFGQIYYFSNSTLFGWMIWFTFWHIEYQNFQFKKKIN
jgi:hypothetical protein